MKISDDKIKIISQYFHDKPIQKAFLFGSQVKGEATPESDIDILVELDYPRLNGGFQFVKMQLDLQDLLKQKVDLLTDKAVSKYMRPYIEKEKQLIYEKEYS